MTRREQVQTACQTCRAKRAKCDGKPCCARCEGMGLKCTYVQPQRESKSSLRAEVERLRAIQHENDILLEAITESARSGDTSVILAELRRGSSREAIMQMVDARELGRCEDKSSITSTPEPFSTMDLVSIDTTSAVDCGEKSSSYSQSVETSSAGTQELASPASTAFAFPPSEPPYGSWICTTSCCPNSYPQGSLGTLVTGDGLQFCVQCSDSLLHGFDTNLPPYGS